LRRYNEELRARMDMKSPYTKAEAYSAKRLNGVQRGAVLAELGDIHDEVGRCRLTLRNPRWNKALD